MLRAGNLEDPGSNDALARVCEDYVPAIRHFARIWLGNSPDVDDLTQGFFCKFVEGNLPGKVSPERGLFRTFLITAFKNFTYDHWRHLHRKREIPQAEMQSIDGGEEGESFPDVPAMTPAFEQELDRFRAEAIRDRVIAAIAERFETRGKQALFTKLSPLLYGQKPAEPYSTMAQELRISETAIKVEALRMREKFGELFTAEVAETLSDQKEVESESRYLASLLYGGATAQARS